MFLREVNNNMYDVGAYYWGKVITELPSSIFFPSVFTVLVYWGVGLNVEHWTKPLIFLVVNVLEFNVGMGLGYVLGTAITNNELSSIIMPLLLFPMMLYTGYFVRLDRLAEWLVVFRELSIFKHGYQAVY